MENSGWIFGLASRGQEIREIEVSCDGLMMRAELSVVRDLLHDRISYVETSTKIQKWYFNETRDREIAEMHEYSGLVKFNPQLLWSAGFEILT